MTEANRRAIVAAMEAYPGTARSLAHEIGVDHSHLLRVCKGERTATDTTVQKMLDLFAATRAEMEKAEEGLREAGE
jgi:hypothetical protein